MIGIVPASPPGTSAGETIHRPALGHILRSTVGLPGLLPHPVPFTTPFLGAVCRVVEIVVVLIAVWALSSARTRAR